MIIPLPAPNLALVGFMGAGKTTIGRLLGERLGLPFLDIDGLVEVAEGISVAAIFDRYGEEYFREREGALFRRLCESRGQIIACGGGTLLDPANRTALRARCCAVWLRTSPEEILRRIETPAAPERPLLAGGEPRRMVIDLLREREHLYAGSDLIVDTDQRTPEAIADEIVALITAIGGGAR